MYFRNILVVLSAFIFSAPVYSATVDNAKVIHAGTYGGGRLFVELDKTIPEAGCERSRFDVVAGHDQIKTWLSIAMAAMASGKSVAVSTDGCLGSSPTLTNANDTWFYMKQN